MIDATASTLLTQLAPGSVGSAIGINRACGAAGRILGPILSLTLWKNGHFKAPFALASLAGFSAVAIVLIKRKALGDAAKAEPLPPSPTRKSSSTSTKTSISSAKWKGDMELL